MNRSGFTLIELLTAISVLTLMLLMVSQLVNSAATVMSTSGRHLDADTQARLLFNRMALDISGMMKRTDIDYSCFKNAVSNPQVGNDQMAFYSETHGYFSGASQPAGTGKADLSLVAYMVANDTTSSTPVLQRLGKGLGWEPADTSATPAWNNVAYLPITLSSRWPNLFSTTTPDADYRTVGDLVFRMEYTYLLKPTTTQAATLSITPYYGTTGHTTINGFKDVAAIVTTIAMLDNSSRKLVNDYTNLTSSLPDAKSPLTDTTYNGHVASAWNAVVNSPTFSTTVNLPKTAVSSVRVYERYFYLDSPQ